jgi:hypothetical protein
VGQDLPKSYGSNIRRDPPLFYSGKLNQLADLRWLKVCPVGNLHCVVHHSRRLHGLGCGSLFSVFAYWFCTGGGAAARAHLLSLPSPTTF